MLNVEVCRAQPILAALSGRGKIEYVSSCVDRMA